MNLTCCVFLGAKISAEFQFQVPNTFSPFKSCCIIRSDGIACVVFIWEYFKGVKMTLGLFW